LALALGSAAWPLSAADPAARGESQTAPRAGLFHLGLLATASAATAGASVTDSQTLQAAKALFFDRRYVEARAAWQAIQAAGGPSAEDAAFWVARASEGLGEHERALGEYERYLALRPRNTALAVEARTARVGVATRLYKNGQTQRLALLRAALDDPHRSVREFAALQLATLGPGVGTPAIPVLRAILAEQKDPDLVDRAKLALLRLDPGALRTATAEAAPNASPAPRTAARATARRVTWIKVRIFERGSAQPKVSINLPVGLAEMAFKSLPDSARRELRHKGFEADNFWERLMAIGPAEILSIDDGDGGRVQISTE
jgi:hypothetical protein